MHSYNTVALFYGQFLGAYIPQNALSAITAATDEITCSFLWSHRTLYTIHLTYAVALPFQCEYFLFSLLLYDSKLNIFESWIKQDIKLGTDEIINNENNC